jgi:hypothetical protein
VKVEGIMNSVVPIDTREPLYAKVGDWLPALCWLLLGASCVLSLIKPRNAM